MHSRLFIILFVLLFVVTVVVTVGVSSQQLLDPSSGTSSDNSTELTHFNFITDSSSNRIVGTFEYAAILIYKTPGHFDVNTFKQRVLASLPDSVRARPDLVKQFSDHFTLLDYCTWPVDKRIPCQAMNYHDWKTFSDRVNIESSVSVCLDTIERSKTGNFGIMPFVNASGQSLPNEQQTLVRFSFNGVDSKQVLKQMNPKILGACEITSPDISFGSNFEGIFAFSGDILSSYLDFPVTPRSVKLPTSIQLEFDRITRKLQREPVNSAAVGIFFFLLLLSGLIYVLHRIWKNKERREKLRQQQQTQEMPEEQRRRIEERARVEGDADPYVRDDDQEENQENNSTGETNDNDVHNNARNITRPEDVSSMRPRATVAVVTNDDDDDVDMEMAIRNVRQKFKQASDSVSTFLGIPRDGDQPIRNSEGEKEEEDENDIDEVEMEKRAFEKKRQAALLAAQSGSDSSSEEDYDAENEYHPAANNRHNNINNNNSAAAPTTSGSSDTSSPPKDRQDTDVFVVSPQSEEGHNNTNTRNNTNNNNSAPGIDDIFGASSTSANSRTGGKAENDEDIR